MKIILVIVTVIVLLAMAPLALLVFSTETVLRVDPAPKVIGFETPLHIRGENSHGIRWITVAVQQDGKSYETRVAQAAEQHMFPERHVAPKDVTVKIGKQSAPALHDGKARVVVTAVSNDFRGKSTTESFDVEVMTTPPQVAADGVQHYINQGGSEMVTFTPSGAWTEAGVKVGDSTFRSFPLPNHPGQYFSLFALFWQQPADTPIYVYATNPSGVLAKASFWYKVFPKQFRKSTIALDS
ncbi:MAG: M23 family peptidase, partial [Acidobacteriota bacterium]